MDVPSQNGEEKIERLRRAMYSRSLSEKLTDRPRRVMGQPRSPVGEDWNEAPPRPEPAGIAFKESTAAFFARWLLVAGAAFLVGVVGFLLYYFTIGAGATPAPPNISIIAPPHVASGELTELQIVVSNRNRSSIESAELLVNFPAGTRASPDAKSDMASERISLGALGAGEMKQVPLKAVFSGSEGQRANVKVDVEYRLQNSSAVFVASSDYELSFGSSALSLFVEGNSETVSGQPLMLSVRVSSNAGETLKDVLLRIDYPFGFALSSADPKPAGAGLWKLGDIEPGESVRIEINGTLSGEKGDERVFRVAAGTKKSPDSRSIDTTLAEGLHRLAISEAFIGLSVFVKKDTEEGADASPFFSIGGSKDIIAAPGENINVSIEWKNNLTAAISDAVIVARLSGIDIDGATIRTSDGFFRSSDSSVYWDKTTTGGSLASLPSGGSGSVSFSFEVPQSAALSRFQNPALTVTVHAAGKRLSESGVPGNLQATASKTIKLASDLQVSANGLYYGNPFGPAGPMPPKANEETSYAILFNVTNTTNRISNAKIRAQLPPYVRATGMLGGDMLFGNDDLVFSPDGAVVWNIGDVAAGAGVVSPPRQAAFAIGFTPSTSQVGEMPSLLSDITLTGVDTSTGKPVTKTVPNVTTNIFGDQGFSSTQATVVR